MNKYKSLNFWCLLFSLFSIASIAKSQEIAVEQPKMNLFYTHINNQIFISCENSENLKISIQDNAGVVKPLGNGRYDVLVYNAGIVFLIIKKNGQQIKKKYRVKQFPNPVAHLSNGKKEGYISYSELHVCNFIYYANNGLKNPKKESRSDGTPNMGVQSLSSSDFSGILDSCFFN